MIKQVKFASVPVRDQQRALEFYTRKLGFQVLTDAPFGNGVRWIELGLGGAQTRIVLFTAPGHEDRIGTFTGISLECDSVEKTHAELSARGVEFTQPPKKEHWGTSAIFKDADGNQFVLSGKA
jgi:catechol 2,3-dioxygenase-like lactoylglutathione lyase family enzyme